jgi:hypothetical protein
MGVREGAGSLNFVSQILLVLQTHDTRGSEHVLVLKLRVLILKILELLAVGRLAQWILTHEPVRLILVNKLVLSENGVQLIPEHREVVGVGV